VGYEWDAAKAAGNLKKHGIDFADAAVALEDEHAVTISERTTHSEERFVTMCMDPLGKTLVVIFTWRGKNIRIISARKATPREKRWYEERS
jgi:uncharacterized DUF497 family protein